MSTLYQPQTPATAESPLREHRHSHVQTVKDLLETPSLDDRQYRVIKLENELEVLLGQDADTDKASAAMDVNVGSKVPVEGSADKTSVHVASTPDQRCDPYPAPSCQTQFLGGYSDIANRSGMGSVSTYDSPRSFCGSSYASSVATSHRAESHRSTGPYVDQTYTPSPLSSLGIPFSEANVIPHGRYISQLPLSSPETIVVSQESSAGLPLFNIERDDDPSIQRFMYYDFVVAKAEAYFQLKPGYYPTDKYPLRINSDKVIINGEKRHPCGVPNCQAKPFTRHYDLERHFLTRHQSDKEQGDKAQSESVLFKCDYKKCSHTALLRDHCREHYREFHTEDLFKRGQPKHSMKKPETVEEFLAARIQGLNLNWWRCSKCLQRVHVSPNGYTCPTCNLACEPERTAFREKARRETARNPTSDTSGLGSAQTNYIVTTCGQCENTWLPDENNESLWISCPRCQPNVKETLRFS